MFPFDNIIMIIISITGPEQDGLHIEHIFKCIFQNTNTMCVLVLADIVETIILIPSQVSSQGYSSSETNCYYFDKTKLSSLPAPEFVIFTTGGTADDKNILQVSNIVYPHIKSGYPMLKVTLTCLNYIVSR